MADVQGADTFSATQSAEHAERIRVTVTADPRSIPGIRVEAGIRPGWEAGDDIQVKKR